MSVNHRVSTSSRHPPTWWEWLTLQHGAPKAMRPMDAAHDRNLRAHFQACLDQTDPPATFKASEVAQMLNKTELRAMGYEQWREAVPAVIELAFEMRAFGICAIFKRGKLVAEDVMAYEIDACRIMRAEGVEEGLQD